MRHRPRGGRGKRGGHSQRIGNEQAAQKPDWRIAGKKTIPNIEIDRPYRPSDVTRMQGRWLVQLRELREKK